MLEHFNNLFEKGSINTNGKRLVHIIDKNGVHKTVWKNIEEIKKEKETGGNQHLDDVKEGQPVYFNGVKYTIKKIKSDGYYTIEDENGVKMDKNPNKLQFVNPLDPTSGPTKSVAESKKEEKESGNVVEEQPLDYELYGTPDERMKDWEKLVNNFALDKSRRLTLSYGTGGVGKSYSVLNNGRISQMLDSGEAVKFTGGTTAAGFFEMLYKNRDKHIILDDFDMVFKDPGMLSLLTSLSRNTGDVILTNPTSGSLHESEDVDKIPPRFEFEGKLMVISNINLEEMADSGRDSADKFDKILTNADKVNLKFTKKETWDLMNEKILHDSREMINGKPNPNKGKLNPGLNFRDSYGQKLTTTDKEKQELVDYFSKNWEDMTELSGRTLTKANAIRKYYSEKGRDWKHFADAMLLQNGPKLNVNERFEVFGDSLAMIKEGDMKAAVVADKDAEEIKEYFKESGMSYSPLGFEMQNQMSEDYEPSEDDTPVNMQFVSIAGKDLTEKALYENLWKHNGKVIIFDKTAKSFLQSDLGQGILKGALDTSGDGEISWLSAVSSGKKRPGYKASDFPEPADFATQLTMDGYKFELTDSGSVDMSTLSHPHDLPDKFAFKGRCIFVVDDINEAPQPIRSRSMLADVNISPEEFIDRAKFVANVREKRGRKFSKVHKDVTAKEYRDAIQTLSELKDHIHPRYFSEEGLQKIIRFNREEHDTKEKKMKALRRELIKSFNDLFEDCQIEKAKKYIKKYIGENGKYIYVYKNDEKTNNIKKYNKLLDSRRELFNERFKIKQDIDNILSEQENDPNVELQGGNVADSYGKKLDKLQSNLSKVDKDISLLNERMKNLNLNDENHIVSDENVPAILLRGK